MAFSELSGGQWRPLYDLSPDTVEPTNQVTEILITPHNVITEAVNVSTTNSSTDANPITIGVYLESQFMGERERELCDII